MWSVSRGATLGPETLGLLRLEEIPSDAREVAIMSGYRPPHCSLRQCLLSAFVATNETLNIWTHFLPTLYFCWRLAEVWQVLNVSSDPYTWAYVVFMMTACLYPLTSSLAHTFHSMSDLARNIWFFLDYGALSFYSFGAGLLYRAYVFPEDLLGSAFADMFLHVCAANTVLCTFMACISRFVDGAVKVKVLRLGAFTLPWIWDSVPLLCRLFSEGEAAQVTDRHYFRQFVFSFLVCFFYATHLPERLAPGKFDIVGHSHQMLHICGVLATNEQMNGALNDLRLRRSFLHRHLQFSRSAFGFWCIDAPAYIFVINVIIISIFSLACWRRIEHKVKPS